MDWDSFIQRELLINQYINGVCLIGVKNKIHYEYGQLTGLSQGDLNQFSQVFRVASEKHEQYICRQGFSLRSKQDKVLKFNIYHKTLGSAYATCLNDDLGLVVCSLPYGVLVCMHCIPQMAGEALNVIEAFCTKLRA